MTKQHISFWGLTIKATVKELRELLGEPEYADNEINQWHGLLDIVENGDMLLYDLYNYNAKEKLLNDEEIEWRINGDGLYSCLMIKDYLTEKILKLRNEKSK